MSSGESPKKKQIKRLQRYRCEWERNELFKDWLQPDLYDDLKALCTVCVGSSFRAEKSVLKHHAQSKKHVRNMRQVIQVERMCRTCLSSDNDFVSIFTISEDFKISFSEVLQVVTGVQVKKGDGLPAGICPGCRVSLTSAYQYQLQAVRADRQLRHSQPESEDQPVDGKVHIKVKESDHGYILEYLDEDAEYVKAAGEKLEDAPKHHLCSYCGGTYTSLCNLQSHILRCPGNPDDASAKCLVCQMSFKSAHKLLRHVKAEHDTPHKPYPKETGSRARGLQACHIPIVGSIDLPGLEEGEGVGEGKARWPRCALCDEPHAPRDMEAHVREHDAEEVIVCSLCDSAYLDFSYFKRHFADHHPELSLTHHEDQVAAEEINGDLDKERLTEYQRSTTIGELLSDATDSSMVRGAARECAACGRLLPSAAALRAHCDAAHRDLSARCRLCSKRLDGMKAAVAHRALCERRSFRRSCGTCGKVFLTRTQMMKHSRLHKPFYECDTCHKKFKKINNFRTHVRTHDPERQRRRHLCVRCGHSFRTAETLKIHMRRHTGEKPYVCNYCGKGYPRKEEMNWHIRIHTGERPYNCKICPKAFRRHTCLRRHMRVHTGERPYRCPHCVRSFTQSNDLARHVRRHTGAKPYQCTVCSEKFSQMKELQKHLKLKHFSCQTFDPKQNKVMIIQQVIGQFDSEANERIEEMLESLPVIVEESTPVIMEESTQGMMEESTSVMMEERNQVIMKESTSVIIKESNQVIMGESTSVIMGESASVIMGECTQVILEENTQVITDECTPDIKDGGAVEVEYNPEAVQVPKKRKKTVFQWSVPFAPKEKQYVYPDQ